MSLTREQIIERLQPVIDSCQEALEGTWDKNDDGFIAMEEALQSLSDDLSKEKDFLERQGINEAPDDSTCPMCGSKDLIYDFLEYEGGDDAGYRWVDCKSCKKIMRAWYVLKFTDWEDEDGDPL